MKKEEYNHEELIIAAFPELNELTINAAASLLKIVNNNRKSDFVARRYLFWHFLMENTKMSLREIGQITGGQDHATVLYGIRQVSSPVLKRYFDSYRKEVDEVTKRINTQKNRY